jgi:hypothetical protein
MRREGALKYRLHDGGWFWVRQRPHFPTLAARPSDLTGWTAVYNI